MAEAMEELRRKTNPLYGDRKLKLGTFGQNLDRGCAISTIDGVLEINWPNTMTIAKLADEMQFEALVPEPASAAALIFAFVPGILRRRR